MKNKYLIGTVLVVGIMSLSVLSAFAATTTDAVKNFQFNGNVRGEFAGLTQEERTAKMEEMRLVHEKMQQVVIDGDYDTWSRLVSQMPMGEEQLKVITKDNFSEFSKAHQLMVEADAILTKLGVEKGPKGFGKGGPNGMNKGFGMGKKCLKNSLNVETED